MDCNLLMNLYIVLSKGSVVERVSFILLICFLLSNIVVAQNQISFQVDMRSPMRFGIFKPITGDSLVVRGTFNSWNGNQMTLTDYDADSIYQGTFDVGNVSGDTLEYKFVIHKMLRSGIWEIHPDSANAPYGNRRILLTSRPQNLPMVMFDFDELTFFNQAKFSIQKLKADFQQMKDAVEDMHPALYDFTEKSTFDSLFDSKFASIDRPLSAQEFYRILAPLVATIGCGHSTLDMPEYFWINAPQNMFPLKLWFARNKVYVHQNYGDNPDIHAGNEIISINGMPMNIVFQTLMSNIPADGYNSSYRTYLLNNRFASISALHYGFPEEFRVTYRLSGETKPRQTVLQPVSLRTIYQYIPWKSKLHFQLLEKKQTAVITINNFSYYHEQDKFYQYIDDAFAKIDELNIKNLILDLRDNDGGDPFCAAHLFSYLARESVPYFAEPFGKYIELAKPIPLQENRFEGNLFILINGKCFSTTGHLCVLLKYHNIGTFIGNETGGTFTCNDAKVRISLQNSRLRAKVAREIFAVAVKDLPKDRGILPHYQVEPTITDLLVDRDTIKEYTLRMIAGLSDK
jgi:hypothetical protein